MINDPDRDELAALHERITKAQKASDPARNESESPSPQVRAWAKVMRIGTDFTATVLGALGLGWFVDEMAGTAPYLMIAFLLAGFVIAFIELVRAVGKDNDESAEPKA